MRNFKPKKENSTKSLKDAIHGLLESYKLEGKFNELKLKEAWVKLMGKTVNNRTAAFYIKGNVIYVKINSASLKNELMINKEKIIRLYKDELGKKFDMDFLFY